MPQHFFLQFHFVHYIICTLAATTLVAISTSGYTRELVWQMPRIIKGLLLPVPSASMTHESPASSMISTQWDKPASSTLLMSTKKLVELKRGHPSYPSSKKEAEENSVSSKLFDSLTGGSPKKFLPYH